MSETTGLTIFGVAALLVLCALLLGAESCTAKGTAAKAEACKAVMASGDERARLLAVSTGGVCSGVY